MRKTIANRLQKRCHEAVHITVTREVDAEALVAAADAGPSKRWSPTSSSVRSRTRSTSTRRSTACSRTGRTPFEEHNVGIAVDIDGGLVTPVVADVAPKSLGEVATERRRLTNAVRSGEYSMSDLRGGTITLSNLGPLGVDSFTPVINPPEVAILGVDRITELAVPDDGDNAVAFRRRITFDLSFDHRVVDGADGARFLGTLAECVKTADDYVDE